MERPPSSGRGLMRGGRDMATWQDEIRALKSYLQINLNYT